MKAHPSHKASECATTRERFVTLCKRLGAKDNLTIWRTYDEIIYAYTRPDRHYHGISHISDGLAEFDEAWYLAEGPDALEMAWWWHDFVYRIPTKEPKPVNNELESAVYAFKSLSILGTDHSACVKIMARIMPTLHTYIPDHIDDQLMVDIDLTSLGTPYEVFELNAEDIRKEYGVSLQAFRVGRAEFFRNFLQNRKNALGRIYITNHFYKKYEAQAQENIKRFLAEVKAS